MSTTHCVASDFWTSRGEPHAEQKWASEEFATPQAEHATMEDVFDFGFVAPFDVVYVLTTSITLLGSVCCL